MKSWCYICSEIRARCSLCLPFPWYLWSLFCGQEVEKQLILGCLGTMCPIPKDTHSPDRSNRSLSPSHGTGFVPSQSTLKSEGGLYNFLITISSMCSVRFYRWLSTPCHWKCFLCFTGKFWSSWFIVRNSCLMEVSMLLLNKIAHILMHRIFAKG